MDISGPSFTGDEIMGTFETQMKEICTMTVDMFNSEPDANGIVGSTEAALVYEAETKVILKRKQAKEMVDLARNELRGSVIHLPLLCAITADRSMSVQIFRGWHRNRNYWLRGQQQSPPRRRWKVG